LYRNVGGSCLLEISKVVSKLLGLLAKYTIDTYSLLVYQTDLDIVGRLNLGDKRMSFKWIYVKLLIQLTMPGFLIS